MKPALAAGALATLLVGGVAVATSRQSAKSPPPVAPLPQQTIVPAAPMPAPLADPALAPGALAPTAQAETAAPVRERVIDRDRVVYKDGPVPVRRAPRARVVRTTRSGRKSAAIIAGSAAGGAITGAIIGGKKGAVIGGLVGGAAGTVYDRKTRKKRRVVYE